MFELVKLLITYLIFSLILLSSICRVAYCLCEIA
jgi:hypothetical protein